MTPSSRASRPADRIKISVGGCVLLAASLLIAGRSPLSAQSQTGSRSFVRGLQLEAEGETSANVSIGDVNRDGHQDIVLVKGRHWPLQDLVLIGDGTGRFAPAYPVGPNADRSYSGVLVDMDNDGDLDIVVSNDDPDPKVVHLNDGTGRYTLGSTFGEPDWSTRHVAIADLNQDGFPDAILANRTGGNSGFNYICPGIAGGAFSPDCVGFSRESATTITAADFDGDGWLDLAVPHRDGGQGYIYLNDREGGFEVRRPFGPEDGNVRAAKSADFNGDGVLDLVVIDEMTGPALLLGQADGSFGAGVPLGQSGLRPYAIAVADLDGNGWTDVIIGYVEARPVVVFNEGGGTLNVVPFGDAEGSAYGFAVGDLNQDGLLDIAMARSGAPNMLYFGGR